MSIFHITYATRNYMRSALELRRTAKKFGLDTTIYTTRSPAVRALYKADPATMRSPRGAGFWRWKPWVILDAMSKAAEGDLILYTDAGMHMIADPTALLRLAEESPSVLFHQPVARLAREWTKRDCFVLMDADSETYWNTLQLVAGFQVHRVSDESRKLVRAWAEALNDNRILTDQPNECGLPNLPEFVAHRHDQSALTILAAKAGIVTHEDPSQFGHGQPFGQVFYLHRRRDEPFLGGLRSRLQIGTRLRRVLGR